MRTLLERRLLPFVMKPGRYVGGELGQIVKDWGDRTTYLHAFPDKYEIGQAHIGSQIIYHIVNRDDRFVCERAYGIDIDAEAVMRREGIELFSLESARPARDFDVIGFSVGYELVYTTILSMLDLAGLPLKSSERNESHPLIIAGGPAVFNPQPIADFIDVFFIGDAEEGIVELLEVVRETKGQSRDEQLRAIVDRVPSTYIPAFYDESNEPTVDQAPKEIVARIARELKADNYPEQPLLPLIDTVHNHLAVEIMRGCPQGCRFCQASTTYKPVRVRSKNDVLRQIEQQSRATGYAEVSLMSLSTSDYPEIEELAVAAARRLKDSRISLSLPSLRPGSITPELLDAVSVVRRAGLTIAPEAGTERLRTFVRKDFADEAIFDSARIAFDKGWTTLKLYFMVGLPTETDEDLEGIAHIVTEVFNIGREYPGRKTINVALSPFVPKPHTPLQWDEICSAEEIGRRINVVKKATRARQVNFKTSRWEISFLAGILGRGDRKMGTAVLDAFKRGCNFDGWTETFNYANWEAAFDAAGIDTEQLARPSPFDAPLPWNMIRKGPSVEHLQAERKRTSVKLKEFVPKFRPSEKHDDSDGPAVSYGRVKKKVASRNTTAPTKNTVRIRWGKSARCRYMSHLDHIRALERAIRRARLPVAFSQGFNPTMKLSFGPPLTLGFTSECEFIEITLDANLEPYMVENLKRAMPDGMEIHDARVVYGKSQSLSAALNRVDYRVGLNYMPESADLNSRLGALLEADNWLVSRTTKSKTLDVDIRPGIYDLELLDSELRMVLGLGQGYYVRPTEVATVLLDGNEEAVAALPFHRRELYRVDDHGTQQAGIEV